MSESTLEEYEEIVRKVNEVILENHKLCEADDDASAGDQEFTSKLVDSLLIYLNTFS